MQGNVVKCGPNQGLLKVIGEGFGDVSSLVNVMSSSFPALSSKRIASTCHSNSSFLHSLL